MRYPNPWTAATLLASCSLLAASLPAMAAPHPIETELHQAFPSISLSSSAAFDPAQTVAAGSVIAGLRVRSRGSQATLIRLQYPHMYDEPTVIEHGSERLVIRPLGAAPAVAAESAGKLLYERTYPDTDALMIPADGVSDSVLVLRDSRAPQTFAFEVLESSGIAAIVADAGGLRCVPATDGVSPSFAGPHFAHPPASLQIARPWIVDAAGRRVETAARWTIEGNGAIPSILRLTITSTSLTYPLAVISSFSTLGGLATARSGHTATLLPDGKVLFAGGQNDSGYLTTAELYDPATGRISQTGNLQIPRYNHTATLLPDGRVVIAGGNPDSGGAVPAEIYDPATGLFTRTTALAPDPDRHTATLLSSGQILLISLYGSTLLDAGSGTVSSTGEQVVPRRSHTATLLPGGKVLAAGGYGGWGSSLDYLNSAELYDPSNKTYSATNGNLGTARAQHTATLLTDGTALIAGGQNNGGSLASAELFTPATGTFSPTSPLAVARFGQTATLLPNGKVLIVGGHNSSGSLASVELYDSTLAAFTTTVPLSAAREGHTATLLPNGRVLIAGGYNGSAYLNSIEIWDSSAGSFTPTGSLSTPRVHHTTTLLPNGKVLIAGGVSDSGPVASAELFDPASGTFTATGDLNTARAIATATLLPGGKVLIAGGVAVDDTPLSSAELYDPDTGTFAFTGSLNIARATMSATLLPNGKALISGGAVPAGPLSSAELFDPATGTFSVTGSLHTARSDATATLLSDGRVLVTGGFDYSARTTLASAEVYDPATGMFINTGSLATPRSGHTATLLLDGEVLITGGAGWVVYPALASAEIYDPLSGTFSSTGSLNIGRYRHAATMLPDGRILIVGGDGFFTNGPEEIYDPIAGVFLFTGDVAANYDSTLNRTATLLTDGRVLIAGGEINGSFADSAELYDAGLGFADGRRPVIDTSPDVDEPAPLVLGGHGFRGDSEGSSGATNSSPSDVPVLELQRIDNQQIWFVSPSSWSDSAFTSDTLSGLPDGYYRVSLIRNGIPSLQRLVRIRYPAPTITNISPSAGPTTGGQSVTISGTNLGNVVNVLFGGSPASVASASATSIVLTTPAQNAGTVVVSVNTAGGTATTSYAYVLTAPASLTATATTSTSVDVSWSAVFGADAYDIARSSDGIHYTIVSSSDGTGITDYGVAPNTSYLYKVRARTNSVNSDYTAPDLATTVMFTDASLAGAPIKAVHFTQLRAAVDSVRVLSGLTPAAWTDPTITPGTTIVKAVHLTELRSNLDEARSRLSLPPVVYTNPTVTPGATPVMARHLLELRSGVE